jgi:pyridoxamine 5'-phosphate oxidase
VPLDPATCAADPFVQFSSWFDEALPVMAEREAVALVTVDELGRPGARMVLRRLVDDHSLGWFTNYDSRKGRELAHNPHAAILWYCEAQGRQVRVEGEVERADAAASDAYFATRSRGSQLGAHASAQSRPLASRAELDALVEAAARRYDGSDVPRPTNWGGYVMTPQYFEFWQRHDDRLHDRVAYEPDGARWRRRRLAP